MAKKLLVFQHTPWAGIGPFLASAAERYGAALEVVHLWEQPIPKLDAYDALIVLGGSLDVDQEKDYPFLVEEKACIRRSILEDRPYLGFCLGHQLLAEALNARIGPNFRPSVGFIAGHLTHDGREHPIFQEIDKQLPLFKWHAQTVCEPLPKHLLVLATSAACQVEALSVENRPHLVGLQFDNHAALPATVADWLKQDQVWLATLRHSRIEPEAILAAAERHRYRVEHDFHHIIKNFVGLL